MGELYARYRRLTGIQRRLLWIAVALEAILIAGVQRDITRRPAAEIRGPKLLWRILATQNVVGPLAYLRFGRRRSSPPAG